MSEVMADACGNGPLRILLSAWRTRLAHAINAAGTSMGWPGTQPA